MAKEKHKRKDGFPGQKAIALPALATKKNEAEPILHNLMVTDIGYYPKAREHYRSRPKGCDQHILIYCTDGQGWCKIADRIFPIRNNDFLIIPANQPHVYAASEPDPWTIYWLHFKGDNAAALVDELSERQDRNNNQVEFSKKRIAVFNDLLSNMERGAAKQNLAFISLGLGYFLSSFLYQECFNINEGNQANNNPVENSISYMKKNTESILSLKQLAVAANLSVSHYSFLFKKHTGYPPIDYFNHLKVQQACQLLQFTQHSINEISYKLGIEDVFYFSRLFKKTMGSSPRHYRKKWQN